MWILKYSKISYSIKFFSDEILQNLEKFKAFSQKLLNEKSWKSYKYFRIHIYKKNFLKICFLSVSEKCFNSYKNFEKNFYQGINIFSPNDYENASFRICSPDCDSGYSKKNKVFIICIENYYTYQNKIIINNLILIVI